MKSILVLVQLNIFFSNVRHSGYSHNVFTRYDGVRLQANKGLMSLPESIAS